MKLKPPAIFAAIFVLIAVSSLWLAWPTTQTIVVPVSPGVNQTIAVTPADTYSGVGPGEANNTYNVITMILALLMVTAVMLVLVKFRITRIYMIVAVGIGYILSLSLIFSRFGIEMGDALAIVLAVVLTFVTAKYPKWWMINLTGFILATGASALLGVSFSIIPVLLLLIFLAIYDVIAVYKTKHMTTLAKGIIDSGTPFALFVIPKSLDAEEIKDGTLKIDIEKPREKREVGIIGLGDYIIPTMFVVSANKFIRDATIYGLSVPAIGAFIGAIAGYFLLAWIAEKYPTAHAGLPPINGCAIAGFMLACAASESWGWLMWT